MKAGGSSVTEGQKGMRSGEGDTPSAQRGDMYLKIIVDITVTVSVALYH